MTFRETNQLPPLLGSSSLQIHPRLVERLDSWLISGKPCRHVKSLGKITCPKTVKKLSCPSTAVLHNMTIRSYFFVLICQPNSSSRLKPHAQTAIMFAPTSLQAIESASLRYGPTAAAKQLILNEADAAKEAILSGVYVTWQPTDGRQIMCGRIGSESSCLCGHSYRDHGIGRPNKPLPKCSACRACTAFRHSPVRPEEVGQWHLPRRRDFDLGAWQLRVRQRPHEYACITCDSRVSDHVVVIESAETRRASGQSVGPAFLPLRESRVLQHVVFGGDGPTGTEDTSACSLGAGSKVGAPSQLRRERGVEGRVMISTRAPIVDSIGSPSHSLAFLHPSQPRNLRNPPKRPGKTEERA